MYQEGLTKNDCKQSHWTESFAGMLYAESCEEPTGIPIESLVS
jgi:hypothetical protein